MVPFKKVNENFTSTSTNTSNNVYNSNSNYNIKSFISKNNFNNNLSNFNNNISFISNNNGKFSSLIENNNTDKDSKLLTIPLLKNYNSDNYNKTNPQNLLGVNNVLQINSPFNIKEKDKDKEKNKEKEKKKEKSKDIDINNIQKIPDNTNEITKDKLSKNMRKFGIDFNENESESYENNYYNEENIPQIFNSNKNKNSYKKNDKNIKDSDDIVHPEIKFLSWNSGIKKDISEKSENLENRKKKTENSFISNISTEKLNEDISNFKEKKIKNFNQNSFLPFKDNENDSDDFLMNSSSKIFLKNHKNSNTKTNMNIVNKNNLVDSNTNTNKDYIGKGNFEIESAKLKNESSNSNSSDSDFNALIKSKFKTNSKPMNIDIKKFNNNKNVNNNNDIFSGDEEMDLELLNQKNFFFQKQNSNNEFFINLEDNFNDDFNKFEKAIKQDNDFFIENEKNKVNENEKEKYNGNIKFNFNIKDNENIDNNNDYTKREILDNSKINPIKTSDNFKPFRFFMELNEITSSSLIASSAINYNNKINLFKGGININQNNIDNRKNDINSNSLSIKIPQNSINNISIPINTNNLSRGNIDSLKSNSNSKNDSYPKRKNDQKKQIFFPNEIIVIKNNSIYTNNNNINNKKEDINNNINSIEKIDTIDNYKSK